MSIPPFDSRGHLPPGIHEAPWTEFVARYAQTERRVTIMRGLYDALLSLETANCRLVYIDGSFVTSKPEPGDFDACWSREGIDRHRIDPIFLTFDRGRAAQKTRFGGELFPADLPEGFSGRTFLDFFQRDRERDAPKGIVAIRPNRQELMAYPPEQWISSPKADKKE